MNAPPVVTLTLPMLPTMEVAASQTADAVLRYLAFPPDAIDEVKHALIEACINAFEHSGSPDRRVYLTFVVQQDRLLVVIRDFGKGFDPTKVDSPRIKQRLSGLQPRGWGLLLIKRLMDQVEYVDIHPGTELRMTKFRRPTHDGLA